MGSIFPLILKDIIKTLDEAIFGPSMSHLYPRTGMTTEEQILQLPVLRRGIHWDQDGRLFVTEIRYCPLTATHFKLVREVSE